MANKQEGSKKEQQPPPEVEALMARKQLEVLCTVRAWQDEDFRRKLLANPKKTLEDALKVKFPAALTITIVEEKPNAISVSLPPKPAAGSELNDDQLEAVAGGRMTQNDFFRRGQPGIPGVPFGPFFPGIAGW